MILGKGVADALGVKQGAYVTVMIPNSDPEMKLLQPKRIRLHVTGILQLSGQLDHSLALVPLADAQQYLDMGDSVTGIALKMNDVFAANKLVRDAGEVTNSYIYIKSWIGKYGYMYRDIQMIRAIMYLAMVLVIGVACFNIVSTLVMAVKDKSADIAVLRTGRQRRLYPRHLHLVRAAGRAAGQPERCSDWGNRLAAADQHHPGHRETGRPLLPVG